MKTPIRALLVLGVLVAASLPALADDVESEAKVSNKVPKIASVEFDVPDDDPTSAGTQIIPPAGGSIVVTATAITEDDNGQADLETVEFTRRDLDNVTLLDGGAKKAVKKTGQGRSAKFDTSFTIPYWQAPGTYTIYVEAKDKPGHKGGKWVTYEVLETLAMGTVQSGVSFGSGAFQPGEVTSATSLDVRNLGNLAFDVEVSGTPLAAPSASIPASKVKTSLSSSMSPMIALGAAPQPLSDFNLAPAENAQKKLYFSLHVPTGDEQYVPAETYRGSITVSAVVDS